MASISLVTHLHMDKLNVKKDKPLRKSKYGLEKLVKPSKTTAIQVMGDEREVTAARAAAYSYGQKHNFVFTTRTIDGGLLIYRVG